MVRVKLSSLSCQQKFQLLRRELNRQLLEREYLIDAVLACVVSGLPGILFGDPGTGKTMAVELVSKAFEARYFYWLHNQDTKVDELFGPLSLKALEEQEIYKRNVKGKAADAEFIVADEIGKTSGVIRNLYLRLINEKRYANPDDKPVPLVTFFGASNEELEADAFSDRIVLKTWVEAIKEESNFEELMRRLVDGYSPKINVKLAISDIGEAKKLAQSVDVASRIQFISRVVKSKLADAGFKVSDRKWGQILRLLQAYAWIRVETVVSLKTIEAILPDCIWTESSQRDEVSQVIRDAIAEVAKQIEDIDKNNDALYDAFVALKPKRDTKDDWMSAGTIAIELIGKNKEKLQNLQESGVPDCENAIAKCDQLRDDIAVILRDATLLNADQEIRDLKAEARTLLSDTNTPLEQWNKKSEQLASKISQSIREFAKAQVSTALIDDLKSLLSKVIEGAMKKNSLVGELANAI